MCEQYKDDRQTLVLMPQGQKRMPTPDMWPTIKKGDFWLIDGQHSVCAAKKIQGMVEWDDPNNQKEKLKTWKALVVWSEDDTKLVDISRFFNMGNKTKAYQASWARNIWPHASSGTSTRGQNARGRTRRTRIQNGR